MHLSIKERVESVLMSGADGVCYYYLNCFICFGALSMAQNVCYYYLNCFICLGALFMAQNVCYYYLNCFICFGALFMAHPVYMLHFAGWFKTPIRRCALHLFIIIIQRRHSNLVKLRQNIKR